MQTTPTVQGKLLSSEEPADAPTLLRVGAALRPAKRVRTSEWARKNMVLTAEMGAERAGPYDPGYFPWGYAVLDVCYNNPSKRGAVCPKMSQGGLTWGALAIAACRADTEPTRMLYMMQREDHAEKLVSDRWIPMVEASRTLRAKCAMAATDGRREIMLSRPFVGGAIDFTGAGSPAGVTSWTYAVVVLDEIDQAEKNFPAKFGSMFEFALGRQGAIRYGDLLLVFSHPTDPDAGVWRLWETVSDGGYWAVDCPACSSAIGLSSALIHFAQTDKMGRPIAHSAELRCPRCAHAISDDERRRIVWPAEGELGHRPGGTGRVMTDMDEAEAMRRPYAGLAINGLNNPYKTLAHFASKLARAEGDEAQRRSVLNVHFGEPHKIKAATIDAAMITEAVAEARTRTLPGGPYGVRFIVSGTDVQAPRDNPTLVTWVAAFTGRGDMLVLALEAVRGIAAWLALHREFEVEVEADADGERPKRMGISCAGIDDKWLGGMVKDACRETTHSNATGARVELIPMGFEAKPGLNADAPYAERTLEKRIDPTRPRLGAIPMFDLWRHRWIDDVVRYFQSGRARILCQVPDGFAEQMTANVLRPVKPKHSWEKPRLEWDKIEKGRDDWHVAAAKAVAVATIRKRLATVHEDAAREADPRAAGKPWINVPTFGC